VIRGLLFVLEKLSSRTRRGCLYNFPRNLAPDFTQYISERPEMSSQDEESKKVRTMKGK
jgi:hypothetical protein